MQDTFFEDMKALQYIAKIQSNVKELLNRLGYTLNDETFDREWPKLISDEVAFETVYLYGFQAGEKVKTFSESTLNILKETVFTVDLADKFELKDKFNLYSGLSIPERKECAGLIFEIQSDKMIETIEHLINICELTR